jgi:AmmeMemoRadiSam system protein B/AmmeMemoRadiSam system protein A
MLRSSLAPVAALLAGALLLAPAACVADPGAAADVRAPAVAGRFYPDAPPRLRAAVERFLRDAAPPAPARPVALVVPHAGYAFSGEIAAEAWRFASGRAPDLVVILGTNHTASGFRKVALSPERAWRTPLGVVEVDREAGEALARADPDVVKDARVHAAEHSIEVQLPFVQVLFPRARILPLVVGAPDPGLCERLGQALATVLRGKNALVVASSDLSHYPSAQDAGEVDRRVLAALASLDPPRFRAAIAAEQARGVRGLSTCACGEAPVLAAIVAARALGATRGTVIRYGHSGDVPLGEPDRVVGYGAVAFEAGPGGADTRALAPPAATAGEGALDGPARAALLVYARETLVRWLETDTLPTTRRLPAAAALPRGAFVTLRKRGELRGCIGQIFPAGPLGATVGRMAIAAALEDPRFPPVTQGELAGLDLEISVLGPTRSVQASEVVPGRDGVVLAKAGRRAVFLPQVATEQGWGREALLDHLCEKGGLPRTCWREGASLEAFQADVFAEARAP